MQQARTHSPEMLAESKVQSLSNILSIQHRGTPVPQRLATSSTFSCPLPDHQS
jgi:hypothetical protein